MQRVPWNAFPGRNRPGARHLSFSILGRQGRGDRKGGNSRQCDIIIYDNSSPVLFSEGDFVIVLANTVKAIIEVKTSIRDTSKLKKIIKICEENAKKIDIDWPTGQEMFNGIFCYECPLSVSSLGNSLEDWFNITDCSLIRKVNNISLGKEKFLHLWGPGYTPISLRGYKLNDLGFAYFISNLLTSLDPYNFDHKSLFFPLESKNLFEEFRIVYPEKEWRG